MNALPMNLMVAPPNAVAPTPGQGGLPRDGSEPGFAQCLEQAVDREPAPADAAGKTGAKAPDKAAQEADTPAENAAPEASDTASRSTAARAARRAAAVASGPGKADVAPQAAVLPDAADTAQAKAVGAADAGAEDLATPPKKDPAPELASLLPGWTPTPATPAQPTLPAGGSAGTRQIADAALAATSTATPVALHADAQAGTKPLRADESALPTSFTLAQPAAAAVQAVTPAQDTAAPAQAHVAAPVDSPGFAPALATQVRWLVRDGLQHAQLSLNPAEMGPVTVQIVLDGREARIDFRADLALTRNAIEASLPVLAAALDDSGLRLTGGGVHDGQTSRQQQGAMAQGGANAGASGRGAVALDDDTPARTTRAMTGPARGLVDLVA